MKIPKLTTTIGCLLSLCCLYQAWAILPTANESLPNYDKRKQAARALVTAPNYAKANARAVLQARVPDIKFSSDNVLGTPRLISAQRGFLTGPQGHGGAVSEPFLEAVSAGDPHRVIKAFLNEHAAVFGHDAAILASANVARDYVTKHNGLRTVVWEQTQEGISVYDGLLVGHVTRNGELVSLADHFVSNPVVAATTGTPNR